MEDRLQMTEAAHAAPQDENVTYRLVVSSPDEAVRALRERFGENVEVVSVKAMSAAGIKGLLGGRRFEVLARPAAPKPPVAPKAAEALYEARAADAAAEVTPEPPPFEPVLDRGRGLAAPSFVEVLKRAGFTERTLGLLSDEVYRAQSAGQTSHRSLVTFGEALRKHFAARPTRPLPRRVAFLSSAGAGRTTALGKWLGRAVFQEGKVGRVFRLEFDRPNRAEGLDLLCEALGLVLEHCGQDGVDLSPHGDFDYFHTPAFNAVRPQENRALGRFLDTHQVDGRVLVLHGAYDASVQRAILRAGRDLGATHLVFTHLDEIPGWGRLWEPLLESELTPLFLSLSPSLTGGLDHAVVDRLLTKTLPGF
jgi:flagellar biosynthesis protein FlhF